MLDFPRWKVWSIVGVLALLCALAIPSFLPERVTANWPVHPRINLGLDLAGGSYLLLEADTQDLANSRIEAMRDQIQGAMRNGTPRIAIGDISVRGGSLASCSAIRARSMRRVSGCSGSPAAAPG